MWRHVGTTVQRLCVSVPSKFSFSSCLFSSNQSISTPYRRIQINELLSSHRSKSGMNHDCLPGYADRSNVLFLAWITNPLQAYQRHPREEIDPDPECASPALTHHLEGDGLLLSVAESSLLVVDCKCLLRDLGISQPPPIRGSAKRDSVTATIQISGFSHSYL